ncbi:diamine acetyltransferase 2-like [Octopus vulgaris]|uniref:Diamine acetyltransferase 2-like n=1 Tax=Octopus vulgaris TaxID=6645 RepID=A0AA36B4W2_OCTVU|nr:diamine acetyltransferase 2-like [Octopus vulgaris]
MASYTVRVAVESDCPEIRRLFAEQEEDDDEDLKSQLTLEDLKKYGFGEDQKFVILVAHRVSDTSATPFLVGYLFFSKIFCTFMGKTLLVDDLYVTPEYRNQGICKQLGHLLVKIALEQDFRQVQWYTPTNNVEIKNLCNLVHAVNESKIDNYFYLNFFKEDIEKLNNCIEL